MPTYPRTAVPTALAVVAVAGTVIASAIIAGPRPPGSPPTASAPSGVEVAKVAVADAEGLRVLSIAAQSEGPTVVDVQKIATPGRPVSPSLAPDGTTIVYAVMTDNGTDLVLTDGATTRPLVSTRELDETGPVWSPDGASVAFEQTDTEGHTTLRLLDVASGEQLEIPSDSPLEAGAAWSPDGDRLAFIGRDAKGTDLYEYDVVARTVSRLTRSPEVTESSPSYAPDSSALAFLVSETTPANTAEAATPEMASGVGWACFVLDPDGEPRRLSTAGQFFEPQWVTDDLLAMTTLDAPGSRIVTTSSSAPGELHTLVTTTGLATFSWRNSS